MPTTLENPYKKNPYGSASFNLPTTDFTKPNMATFGDTEVITNKPIISQGKYSLPTGNFKSVIGKGQKDFENYMKLQNRLMQDAQKIDKEVAKDLPTKANWWKSKTKTQKALIIGGGSVAIVLATFLIYKASKTLKK